MEKRSLFVGVGIGLGIASLTCYLKRRIRRENNNLIYFTKGFPKGKCGNCKGRVVVTGGAGYIGSHTSLLLLEDGWEVFVLDNLVNSSDESLNRVRELSKGNEKKLHFIEVDLCDYDATRSIFTSIPDIEAVIHFAGLKAVGESVQKPLLYYENNLLSSINVLKAMDLIGCNTFIFSSSATVYGHSPAPLTEKSAIGNGITNPYGQTKYMIEIFLRDLHFASEQKANSFNLLKSAEGKNKSWNIVVLRYFNPIGAHPSGRIGEDPNGPPNNLMPYVSQVAVGKRPILTIFGNDYDTKDGTGVRDYIHVMDLSKGHISALNYIKQNARDSQGQKTEAKGSFDVFNLGTGTGYSVLEMVAAMETASGKKINYQIGDRREGDLNEVYSESSLAKEKLGWVAEHSLEQMCQDLWRWQSNNPNGYHS